MTSALWLFQGHWRPPEFSPPMRCSAAGAEQPGGWRSNTQRKPKRFKRDGNLKKNLDSLIGSSDLLAVRLLHEGE
jgi:hypothetical protein